MPRRRDRQPSFQVPPRGIAWRFVLRARFGRKCARFSPLPPYSRTILAKVRSFRPLTPCFARDSGENARVPAPRPVFRARFGRKCARSGFRPRVSRTILAKVRSFRPHTPSFARVLGESVLDPAFALVFRARFRRKCARRGSYCGASGAFAPDSRPEGLFWNESGAFSPKTRPVRGPGQQGPARAEVLTPQKNFARAEVPPPAR